MNRGAVGRTAQSRLHVDIPVGPGLSGDLTVPGRDEEAHRASVFDVGLLASHLAERPVQAPVRSEVEFVDPVHTR